MIEIVFDESKSASFLGQDCPLIECDEKKLTSIKQMRGWVQNLLMEFAQERVLKIKSLPMMKLYLLTLVFSIESYEDKTNLETVVFEVSDSRKAIENYGCFSAVTNAIRYMRDLLRMEEKEAYADIKRLGYLGLNVEEDYLKQQIIVKWHEGDNAQILCATQNNAAFMLIALFKFWAICKDDKPRIGLIGKNVIGDEFIPNLESEDEMIEYVINNTVREKCKLMTD